MTHSFPTRRASDLDGEEPRPGHARAAGGARRRVRDAGRLQRRLARPLDAQLRRLPASRGDQHAGLPRPHPAQRRSEEHTSELQSLMRISYAVFSLKKKKHLRKDNKITRETQ